ncbi:MAG: hypothetical protein AAF202_12295, partial [Pseudomonadota bacterium]
QALVNCQQQTTHFDECWLQDTGEKDADGQPKYMLMTKITIPMFKMDERDGRSYMFFPRIAYDGPSLINGLREFLIGNGQDFSADEITALLQAFFKTREGIYQSPGDILLVDNIRFGHSREPYHERDEQGQWVEREATALMAGEFFTDDAAGQQLSAERGQ